MSENIIRQRAAMARPIYSVKRAKKNLTLAIRYEIVAARDLPASRLTQAIYARECAVRDLIASVRAEERDSNAKARGGTDG